MIQCPECNGTGNKGFTERCPRCGGYKEIPEPTPQERTEVARRMGHTPGNDNGEEYCMRCGATRAEDLAAACRGHA